MIRDGDLWVLRVQTGDKSFDAWVSTLEEENPADFEVANHFVATHPGSPFVNWITMPSRERGASTTPNSDRFGTFTPGKHP